jgi:hypothetical protein
MNKDNFVKGASTAKQKTVVLEKPAVKKVTIKLAMAVLAAVSVGL